MKEIKEVRLKQQKYCAMLDAEKVKLNRLVSCACHWDYLLQSRYTLTQYIK